MRKHIVRQITVIALAILMAVFGVFCVDVALYAKESRISPVGKLYELDTKSKYVYSDDESPEAISTSGSQFGQFSIKGDLVAAGTINGYDSYEVSNGTTTLTYETGGTFINAEETEWHLIEDKLTEVNGEKVDGKILKGALILQTSNNAQNWITELVNANLAGDTTEFKSDFYNTPEIQLLNGCYYRVIVAYEVERKVDEKQYSILNHEVYSQDQNEQKRLVEVYEFYLKDTSEAVIAAGAHPNTKKVVGDFSNVTNTGKDNGFSGHNAITEGKDPHYGWSLGEFRINGYTNTADYQGEEFFLKNLGDAITLTFTLKQDINCLNGNSSLSIAEDKNGSDQYFQIPKTDFKHGALIIRHTDFQGNKSDPIIYTDYLAAYARTGADTRVQFFEEGDYEVALDYEIKNSSGIDSYSNYRMFFTFKIRNGNNMVYAFDNSTKSQLADKAWTPSGFTIDTANSHYLTVTVKKYSLIDGIGGKQQDLSWSRTANDGNSYTDTGIYVVSVSNKYQPNGDESKTFYVGNDPYIRAIAITGKPIDQITELIRYSDYEMQDYLNAMSKEHKSLDEIVSLVNEGYGIDQSGQLIAPPEPASEPEIEQIPEEVETTEADTDAEAVEEIEQNEDPEQDAVAVPATPIKEDESDQKAEEPAVEDNNEVAETNDAEKRKRSPAPIIVLIAVAASAGGFFTIRKKKSGSNEN